MGALLVLAAVAYRSSDISGIYVSQAQKDRQLAQSLDGVYRGPVNVSSGHDNDDV